MHVEGTIQEADYVRAQYLHLRPRPVFVILGVWLLAACLWAIVVSRSWILAGCLTYFAVWYLIVVPMSAKKNFKQYKALSYPGSMEVREDGLFFQTTHGEALIPWANIIKWRRNRKLILLYQASNLFHLVPSHFFPTPELREQFIAEINTRCGDPT